MTANTALLIDAEATKSATASRWLTIGLTSVAVVALMTLLLQWVYRLQSTLPVYDSVFVQQLVSSDPGVATVDAWTSLTLPEKLCRADCSSRYKLYRADIRLAGGDTQGIYLPMFDGAAAVYLNGHKVGQTGSMTDPIADMTYQPAMFELPRDLIQTGDNQLDVVVASLVPAGGRLIPFHVGAIAELSQAYSLMSFLTVDVLSVSNGIFLILGFCALLLYVSGDRDRLYLWFVLLLCFAAARNINVLLPESPASLVTRNWIYLTATLGVLMTTLGLVGRLAMQRESMLDIALVLILLPASALIWYGLEANLWVNWLRANTAIRIVGVLLLPLALIRFVWHARKLPLVVHSVIFALLTVGFVLVLHDIVLASPPRILVFQLSNLAALPMVLCFCVTLVSRYASHLAAVKTHNAELRAAVAERESELEESYARASERERLATLSDERQRIMQDMHDGVAGRLAVMLQTLRRSSSSDDAVTDELQRSLQDLRLTIDSLDNQLGVHLGSALDAFYEHMQATVQENDIEFVWDVDANEAPDIGPEKTLHIYRCLQEAINNVLRHAEATQLTIKLRAGEREIDVSISDDGKGFDPGKGNGRGLGNMRQRIESIGGTLAIESGASGTNLAIQIPLSPP
ncbi:MAG: ATP-binding protein [Woeseiaceae bacterium]